MKREETERRYITKMGNWHRTFSMLMLLFLFFSFLFTSCYHKKEPSSFRLPDSLQEVQISRSLCAKGDTIEHSVATAPHKWAQSDGVLLDTFSFRLKHHYTQGFNFIVRADSLTLIRQEPEEAVNQMEVDSFFVAQGKSIAVANIRIMPNDSIDSVWVQIVTEDLRFGWTREHRLLEKVDPANPISQFISMFSDTHLLLFLIVIALISVTYLMRKIMKQNAKIVHLNDINSFYPMLLAIIVAMAATFYATIQLFAPEMWREFYFHPSLNPFLQPRLLNAFLLLVWAMVIVGLAAVDEVRRLLQSGDALLYLCGLAAVCAVNYIVFSILTLYYIGYGLLIVYVFYAIRQWRKRNTDAYECGKCNARLKRKGRCPHCGAMNE